MNSIKTEEEDAFWTHFQRLLIPAFYQSLCQTILTLFTNPNSGCVLLPCHSHNVPSDPRHWHKIPQTSDAETAHLEPRNRTSQSKRRNLNRPPPTSLTRGAEEKLGKERGTELAAMWQQAEGENRRRHETEARGMMQSNTGVVTLSLLPGRRPFTKTSGEGQRAREVFVRPKRAGEFRSNLAARGGGRRAEPSRYLSQGL